MRPAVLVGLCCSLPLAACDSAGSNFDTPLPVEAGDPIPGITFRDGMTWTYASQVDILVAREGREDLDSLVFSQTDTVFVRVASTDAAVDGLSGLVRLDHLSGRFGPSKDWYRVTADRMEEVAYENAGANPVAPYALPLPPPAASGRMGGAYTCEQEADGELQNCFVREEPFLSYVFPLDVGQSWQVLTPGGEDAIAPNRREVERLGETVVEAGAFATASVVTRWDVGENLWIAQRDRVSVDGLVLRESEEFAGEGIGWEGRASRWVRRIELIGIERP